MTNDTTPQGAGSQRDELLQVAIDFIGTLTGMSPPPIEVAPPEVFAPFFAFVERVQAITAAQPAALQKDSLLTAAEQAWTWMENQAEAQSKGGHATFDLMMLREERDALRAAIDEASKAEGAQP